MEMWVVGVRLCLGFGGFLAVVGAKIAVQAPSSSIGRSPIIGLGCMAEAECGVQSIWSCLSLAGGDFCFEQRAKLPRGILLKDIKLDFLISLCSRTSPLLLDCMCFYSWVGNIKSMSLQYI